MSLAIISDVNYISVSYFQSPHLLTTHSGVMAFNLYFEVGISKS